VIVQKGGEENFLMAEKLAKSLHQTCTTVQLIEGVWVG
jgi:hypothetical protein